MGQIPSLCLEWTNQLATRDTEKLKPLLDDQEQLRATGLTDTALAIRFCRHLVQPLQDRAHPAFEYGVRLAQPESPSARSPRRR
jgi:hypothetical protein